MDNVFDKLRDLPLFQGISETMLHTLLEKYPFHFLKFSDGEQIIKAGEPCTHIRFIFSGPVRFVTKSNVAKIAISYTLQAPEVIGVDYLFGLKPNYPFDAFAQGDCGVLQLTKSDYISILQSDQVFIFNILNYLSRNSQESTLTLLSMSHGNMARRLSFVLRTLAPAHSSDVKLEFKQKDFCLLLGARRSSLLTMLQDLGDKQLLNYTQSSIMIADRDIFLEKVNTQ